MPLHLRALGFAVFLSFLCAGTARAQAADSQETRTATIEEAQEKKAAELHPYVPGKAEKALDYAEGVLTGGVLHWHPFFDSAYAGGGFTLGAGYLQPIGSYNSFDVRGSYTIRNYSRLEAQFTAPRLFNRQGTLSLLGGWRKATEVGFYGFGTSTSVNDRVNYGFEQPYASATLDVRPGRSFLVLSGSAEATEWRQIAGAGAAPSIETVYTPDTLPGLGASPKYLHTQGMIGFDWRLAPEYARRGGFYSVTFHDFTDPDNRYGFTQWDYDAVQHVPILRETWVLSFHGRVETTGTKSEQLIPFFMMPSIGSGSTLRAFHSWRFRDRNSLLLQAEWRIMANRFLDSAVFYDAGKVTAHSRDLDLNGLKSDYGIGFRFHGPTTTPLRIDFAHGNEGLNIVFAVSAVF